MTKQKVSTSYDKEADVVYVTISDASGTVHPEESEPTFCQEFNDDVLIERGIHSGLISGFRILNFRKYRRGQVTINPLMNVFRAILFENSEAAKRAAQTRQDLVGPAIGAIERKLMAMAK
jgi:uncharacterized protein YuzE